MLITVNRIKSYHKGFRLKYRYFKLALKDLFGNQTFFLMHGNAFLRCFDELYGLMCWNGILHFLG